jgi:hypothetical protein
MRWPALSPKLHRRKWLRTLLLLTDIVDARGESLLLLIVKTSSYCLQMAAEVCYERSLGNDCCIGSMLLTLRMVPSIASRCLTDWLNHSRVEVIAFTGSGVAGAFQRPAQ